MTPLNSSRKQNSNNANSKNRKIVISGMSGLFPRAQNVEQFCYNLYNKENPISSPTKRWKYDHPELSQYVGNVNGLDNFDAQFFRVHYRLGTKMDAMARKLLEQAYQAIFDAGLSPEHLNGKHVGVYIGCYLSETEKAFAYDYKTKTDFGMVGCSKTMFANRISYWLNAKGPSMAIDAEGCSSTAALDMACQHINRGVCESAIVGGCNLCLHPQTVIQYGRAVMISKDGKSRSFDENACGCAKSEAINVLFIQRAEHALRIYAELSYVKCEFTSIETDETGPKFGFYRKPEVMIKFLNNFYKEANVTPSAVEYVDAFGSATPIADIAELQVIDKVFCNNKQEPLLIGNAISHIGYSNASHGISAIIKVLLSHHTGKLFGNLHLETPRQDVEALRDGRIRILTENQDFNRTYTALNCFSVNGVNSHVLLNGSYKPKDHYRYKCNIPYLVTLSGRQESAVEKICNEIKSHRIDPEQLALLHHIHEKHVKGHMSRGFIILDANQDDKTVVLSEKIDYFDDTKRPLWFVYSGMGSQWTGMGEQLMCIPTFAAAIEKCQRVLKPKGVDILNIITSKNPAIFNNILNSFIGIAAIQIGLTDVLHDLGIIPDNLIGHSVGELGCGYADGCFTAEEMILAAYARGEASMSTKHIRGSMAAVGMGYQQISKICPPDIEVACHNSAESCTISGPIDRMQEFVTKLTENNIFAKEVPCSNIAYHSKYIADAGPLLLKYLNKVITSPKPRSKRWISTSVPQDKWDEPLAKYCSAEYHTNNLLSPVLFEESSQLIPENAVLVEVAPHGLLRAILSRSLPKCINISLTRRRHPDNVVFFMEAVGRLYQQGLCPKVKALYPKIEFPVSTGTPMLSHLVEWNHVEKWPMTYYAPADRKIAAACNFVLSIHDNEHNFYLGNIIRGKILYPFAATLIAVWDTLAMFMKTKKRQISVGFREVHLYSQPVLHNTRQLHLSISFQRGTGWFEVTDEITKVATGYIYEEKSSNPRILSELKHSKYLDSNDVYSQLTNRGYLYKNDFQCIYKASISLTEAELLWNNNWVTFIDSLIQLNALRRQHNGVSQPCYIRTLTIDVASHNAIKFLDDGRQIMNAHIVEEYNITSCGGVTMEGIRFIDLPSLNNYKVTLTALKCIPSIQPKYMKNNNMNETYGVQYYTDIQNTRKPVSQKSIVILRNELFGTTDSLQWVQMTTPRGTGITVKVHYAGLNYLDAKQACGEITLVSENNSLDHVYGMEFSGVTENGTRVMGLVEEGAVSSQVLAQPQLLWPVPEHWTLEEAATIPLAYCLAFYCMVIKYKNVVPLTRVFVHGGAGALGQAVISVALANGCEVFTTVSDVRKKHFLRQLFPNLQDDHIGNSRDHTFSDVVLNATNGNGCDLVLTCVRGNLKNDTLRCCTLFGFVMDLTQIHNRENFQYGMSHLAKSRSYITTDISALFNKENIKELMYLQKLVSEGIARGYVRPLSRVTYEPRDVSRAFALLSRSRHRGRVLLRMNDLSGIEAQHEINCCPDKCHIIVCDNEVFGAIIAERLVQRGVRKLQVICAGTTDLMDFKMRYRSWKNLQVLLKTYSDAMDENISNIIKENKSLGPVEGIHITITNNYKTMSEIVKLTNILKELDEISRKRCPSLLYFGILSANDHIGLDMCMTRVKNHLPATILKIPVSLHIENDPITNEPTNFTVLDIIDAYERSILSQEVVTHMQKNVTHRTLLQQITEFADIKYIENANEQATLFDLGLDVEKSQALFAFLHNTLNITLAEEEIPFLTVNRIQEIEDILTEKKYEDTMGLKTFISYVDPDELQATTELTFLPTRTTYAVVRSDEFDLTQTHLCIIPGLEKDNTRYKLLCERLKLPALLLQSDLSQSQETIVETAQRYCDIIFEKMRLKSDFYLLGYESGVLIALEMAAILEKNGITGTVFCIGGGPMDIKILFKHYLPQVKPEEPHKLKETVVKHMITLMSGNYRSEAMEIVLQSNLPWNEKMEACIRMLLGRVKYSVEYMRNQIKSSIYRLLHTLNYETNLQPLSSKIVVLKPALNELLSAEIEDVSQSLQSLSKCSVVVHELQAPLAHATYDLRCASIINNYLSDSILQDFENTNLCDTSLLNIDPFIYKIDS